MRIFLGLVEVAGYYRGLAEGFTRLGHEVTFVDFTDRKFHYGYAETLRLERWIQRLGRVRRTPGGSRVVRAPALLAETLARVALFAWAALTHDVFIFGLNSSFLYGYELAILRLLKRKIIYQYHGSDSRPPYLDGYISFDLSREGLHHRRRLGRKIRSLISRAERYADVIVNIPPQAHYHRRPYLDWMWVGLPSRPTPTATVSVAGPPRVLHCPSSPEAKGTAFVRSVMEELKREGLDFEYVEIIGQPHSRVREELAKCALVVDQAYADYPMPGFATEAAWFGKPAVLGGYAVALWKNLLPPELIPPTRYCWPEEMIHEIRRLVNDAAWRREVGEAQRSFVENHWRPDLVAQHYLDALAGRAPAWSWRSPQDNLYVGGFGLPEEKLRQLLGAFLAEFGPGELGLAGNPALVSKLTALVEDSENAARLLRNQLQQQQRRAEQE